MATFKTDIQTKQADPKLGSRAGGNAVSGVMLYATATHTCTGAEVADDLIEIVTLPVGVTVIPALCSVANDGAGGTGGTIATLGDAGDDDRYSATAAAVTAAGIVVFTSTNAQAVTPAKVTSGNEIIKGKLALSSGSFTAGKKITFRIAYLAQV